MNSKVILLATGIAFAVANLFAFTPEEARRVYGEASASSTSSSMDVGDYVFMEVKWKAPDDSNSEDADEASEMSAMMDALEAYIIPKPVAVTNSPFCSALTTWMIPESTFVLPNVDSAKVKEEVVGGEVRAVVAFDAKALHAARDRAVAGSADLNKWSKSQWTRALRKAYGDFKSANETSKFFTLLGCPIVHVIMSGEGADFRSPVKGFEAAWNEVKDIMDRPAKSDSFFAKNRNLLWTGIATGRKSSFYPEWKEDDGGRCAEAIRLYNRGKNVPKIINLLSESIAINPIGTDKWGYLGGALKVTGQHKDALFAYLQSIRFDLGNAWAWKGLRECCEKCGYKENAKGLSWYLRIGAND